MNYCLIPTAFLSLVDDPFIFFGGDEEIFMIVSENRTGGWF